MAPVFLPFWAEMGVLVRRGMLLLPFRLAVTVAVVLLLDLVALPALVEDPLALRLIPPNPVRLPDPLEEDAAVLLRSSAESARFLLAGEAEVAPRDGDSDGVRFDLVALLLLDRATGFDSVVGTISCSTCSSIFTAAIAAVPAASAAE